MKAVILLFASIYCAFAGTVKSLGNSGAEDNYQRFLYMSDDTGNLELVDLEEGTDVEIKVQKSDVHYHFYSHHNRDSPHEILDSDVNELENSNFDPEKPILFVIHGWRSSKNSNDNNYIKTDATENHEINVFIVDWSNHADNFYPIAKNSVDKVGEIIGQFINSIQEKYNLSGSQFRLVGHSLGAHVAGNAGAVVNDKVDHIVGLDPAAPLFNLDTTEGRLDTSDANFVQVIHTSCRILGISSPIGHSDYYPNGGYEQAGCGSIDIGGGCAHNRVGEYYAESLQRGKVFIATKCESYDEYLAGDCNGHEKSPMGLLNVDKTASGVYYLTTNEERPFGQS